MDKQDLVLLICTATFFVAVGAVWELARLNKTLKRMDLKMAASLNDLDNAIAQSALSANSLGDLATALQDTVKKLVDKINSPTATDYSNEVSQLTSISTILKSVSDQMNSANLAGTTPLSAPSNPPSNPDSSLTPTSAPNAPQPVVQTVTPADDNSGTPDQSITANVDSSTPSSDESDSSH